MTREFRGYGIGEYNQKGIKEVSKEFQDIQIMNTYEVPCSVSFEAKNERGLRYPTRVFLNEPLPENLNLRRDLFDRLQGVSLGPRVYKGLKQLEEKAGLEPIITNSGSDYLIFISDSKGRITPF
jgi:hypothetical protein